MSDSDCDCQVEMSDRDRIIFGLMRSFFSQCKPLVLVDEPSREMITDLRHRLNDELQGGADMSAKLLMDKLDELDPTHVLPRHVRRSALNAE